jgi:hypothetical protein
METKYSKPLSTDKNFCSQLHNELSDCNNKLYIFGKNNKTTCKYFETVYEIKCLGIPPGTLDKINKLNSFDKSKSIKENN